MQMDVGSWFSEEYTGLHFSTLDEVLDVCKDVINVQIEIKPTKYDQNLPEQVADIIEAHDMADQCLVISLKAEPLKTIKAYDPSIKTGYCMAVAGGDLSTIDFADAVTIEEQNVDVSVVEEAHEGGFTVFVWTINDTEDIQSLVDTGIDGIITDDPVKISKALDEAEYSGGIARLLRLKLE